MTQPLSIIIPTFQRESILVDSLIALGRLLQDGDEIIVVDQTPVHEPATQEALDSLCAAGRIRYYRRRQPSQNEAMNIAAQLARNELLLFLDDDIVPGPDLLEAHRVALSATPPPPATCGQVLQPWNAAPVTQVEDFDLGFNTAYDRPCRIRSLIGANFGMRRETYLAVGGMDENFNGANYRNDAEMAWRVCDFTGRRIEFLPQASLRHLYAGGGNRAFGHKDSWGHIGGSIGDYYFAMKWLAAPRAMLHSGKRLVRASLNRNTVRHPWLIPSLAARELVALVIAARRLFVSPRRMLRPLVHYEFEGAHDC